MVTCRVRAATRAIASACTPTAALLRDPALYDTCTGHWLASSRRAANGALSRLLDLLYRIAHNRMNDHWRAMQHRPPAPADADLRTARVEDPDTPERNLSAFESRRNLQLALDALPSEQREVLVLRLEQELSLEEIGGITGVGRETVKSRLRYAMDKLRQRLQPADAGDGAVVPVAAQERPA